MKKQNISKLYVKYIIKTPVIFYLFLIIGAVLFLYMTITLQVDYADGTKSLFELIFIKAGKGI